LALAVPVWMLLDSFEDPTARMWLVGIGVVAVASDYFDGYLARKLDQVTEAGKIADPLADKALVIIVFLKLWLIGEVDDLIFWLALGRDALILLGGVVLARKIGKITPSDYWGKVAVTILSAYIMLLFFKTPKDATLYLIMYWLSVAALVLSFAHYVWRGIQVWRKGDYESV
jgi:CDP-diacylglycerol--glycerol-3-phosphate 3-phosphatidyltransferase